MMHPKMVIDSLNTTKNLLGYLLYCFKPEKRQFQFILPTMMKYIACFCCHLHTGTTKKADLGPHFEKLGVFEFLILFSYLQNPEYQSVMTT